MCLMLPKMLFDLFHIPDHLVCVYELHLIVVLMPLCVHVQQLSLLCKQCIGDKLNDFDVP